MHNVCNQDSWDKEIKVQGKKYKDFGMIFTLILWNRYYLLPLLYFWGDRGTEFKELENIWEVMNYHRIVIAGVGIYSYLYL